MTVLDLEKKCPVCGQIGPAMGVDGEHIGVWKCKNDNCPKEFFAHSELQFYNVERMDWNWDNLENVMG